MSFLSAFELSSVMEFRSVSLYLDLEWEVERIAGIGEFFIPVNPLLFTGMLLISILMFPSITSFIFVLVRSDFIILATGIPWGGFLH